jgi:hypothetical protein
MTVYEALHILDLKIPVSHAEIKRAFRAVAKASHPDKVNPSQSSEWHKQKFIESKKAYDLLMRHSEFEINTATIRIQPKRNRASERRPVYRKPEPVINHPFVKEAENVALLFANIPVPIKLFFSRITYWKGWNEPFTIFSAIVEQFRKKQNQWKGNLGRRSFAFYRFLSYSFNLLLMVVSLLFTALAGICILMPLMPAFLFFWLYYECVQAPARWIVKSTNKSLRKTDKLLAYLVVRTIPYLVLILAIVSAFRFLNFKFFISGFLFSTALFTLFMLLSVSYEWVRFFKPSKN